MIHLPSTKTFIYTTPTKPDRCKNMCMMMSALGFSNWELVFGSIAHQPYWAAMHDDWVKILDTPAPFLILEDDATITNAYTPEITYPPDAELVYLGGTTHGELGHFSKIAKLAAQHNWELIPSYGPTHNWHQRMLYSEYNDDYIRVFNMHSIHAILIVNDEAKDKLQQYIHMNRDMPVDAVLASFMYLHNVYCRKRPFWYQNDGHNNRPTLEYYSV